MRVSFEHKEITKGLFKKKVYIEVRTTVQFSDEELAIIKNRKLEDFIVLERDPDLIDPRGKDKESLDLCIREGVFNLTIGKLMKGKSDGYHTSSPVHAQSYEDKLTAKLKELKDFIVGCAVKPESKTIEF